MEKVERETMMKKIVCVAALLAVCGLARAARSEDYYVIPYKTDPPIVVDGRLDDWANVPNAIVLNKKEQVTYGADGWKSPDDLSAVIHLAWREGGLFIAAEVTDDVVNQPYRGGDIWMGDHVNLWMDLTPGTDADRIQFGRGQFHVVFSPGNLGGVKGDEKVTPPEIHTYRPEGLPEEGGEIVSRRTDKGFVIEAFAPWSRLGIPGVKMNQDANFEVALSDADAAPAHQEKLMTYGVKPWVYSRERMLLCVLGDGNGHGAAPARAVPITASLQAPAQGHCDATFQVPMIPADKTPYLFFKARLQAADVKGVQDRALQVELNGRVIPGDRISNRHAQSRFTVGKLQTFVWPDGALGLFRAPAFDAPVRSADYMVLDYAPDCEYEFDVRGLIKPGENALRFDDLAADTPEQPGAAIIADVALRLKATVNPPPPPAPAPTGELRVIRPQTEFPRTWSKLENADAAVSFTVSGERFSVQSRFSAPDGKWYTGSSPFYQHSRKIVEHDEYLEVRDAFKNLKDEPVPVIQEHACDFGGRMKRAWLGGYEMPGCSGRKAEPGNPSAFATTDKAGLGMLPNNDEFLVHVEMSCGDGAVRLADRSYVLDKGATYTAVWFILPVPRPEFWDFINQARRARDVNFPLKYMFAFMSQPWEVNLWKDENFREYIGNKSANFVVASNNLTRVEGRYPRCTELYSADLSLYRKFFDQVRRLYPDGSVKTGMYYHCFLDTTPANVERFKADRALDEAGKQIDYGGENAYMKVYIPFLGEGRWGGEIAKWLDLFLDDMKVDGIFWDEFSYSRVLYAYNFWDHCSGDIDPKTFQLQKTKGSVPLLSLPFRLKMVKRILSEGRPFVINGAPFTRTMLDQKFMAFTETGSITNCRLMLLHSPVALGDSLTERVPEDAYKDMLLALDLGCLYSWYDDRIYPTHKTLTEYMFPFTPIELHEGYVIGKERILTDRSGLFGWGDKSEFSTYVFDRSGKETQEIEVKRVTRDGAAFAEVRIPEGYSVALVREPRPPDWVISHVLEKIDYKTLEIVSMPLGKWMDLRYGNYGLYKNPKTGEPTMVNIMVCHSCGAKIPEMPVTQELAHKGQDALQEARAAYRCPKCGKSPYPAP
jgi:hypothetical protein